MRTIFAFILLFISLYGAYATVYLALTDKNRHAGLKVGLSAAFFIAILVAAAVGLGLAENFGLVDFNDNV